MFAENGDDEKQRYGGNIKMNIYEFINSKDIREHCEKIGHTFNSVEAAFLIYQSQNHTLTEKHNAWKELIETMPDMVIEERFNCPHYDSLHDFLRQYMALEDKWLIAFFQTDGNWVYRFNTVVPYPDNSHKGDYDFERITGEQVYHSFTERLALEKEDWEDSQLFYVEKMRICTDSNNKYSKICIYTNNNGIPLEIDGIRNIMADAETELYGSFEGMWIEVPTPFKKGNIVFVNLQNRGYMSEQFVLTHLCTDKETEDEKRTVKRLLKIGDTTDMFAYGYCLSDTDGEIQPTSTCDYLNLEYFRGNMSGHRRVLKVIQDFYQNKQDIGSCMIAYHYILTEEYWKQQKWNHSCMLDGYRYSEKNTEGI